MIKWSMMGYLEIILILSQLKVGEGGIFEKINSSDSLVNKPASYMPYGLTEEEVMSEMEKMKQEINGYINSLPDTLYSSLDLEDIKFEDIFKIVNMPDPYTCTIQDYYKGVARFLRILELKNIDYVLWTPIERGLGPMFTAPLFLDYTTKDGNVHHIAIMDTYGASITEMPHTYNLVEGNPYYKKYILHTSGDHR